MRDPKRIDPMLAKLREAWTLYPDMRLGQLLVSCCQKSDIFGVEDDVMSDNLDDFIKMMTNALAK